MMFVLLAGGGALAWWKLPSGWLRPAAPPAVVELQVLSDPSGAQVTINGKMEPLLTPSLYRLEQARTFSVRVELAGFVPREESIELLPSESAKALKVSLSPVPRPTGRLEVRTAARSARWELDGKDVGNGSGVLHLERIEIGPHDLSVAASGFQTRRGRVEVSAGESSPVSWVLEPVPADKRPRAHPAKSPVRRKGPPSPQTDENDIVGWPPR